MSDVNQLVNGVMLILYLSGLALSTGAMVRRVWRFHRAGVRVPPLLWRDVYCFGTATFTVSLVLIARVIPTFNPLFSLKDETWWYLLTGIPVVSGILIWTVFELVLIPANERRGESAYDNR